MRYSQKFFGAFPAWELTSLVLHRNPTPSNYPLFLFFRFYNNVITPHPVSTWHDLFYSRITRDKNIKEELSCLEKFPYFQKIFDDEARYLKKIPQRTIAHAGEWDSDEWVLNHCVTHNDMHCLAKFFECMSKTNIAEEFYKIASYHVAYDIRTLLYNPWQEKKVCFPAKLSPVDLFYIAFLFIWIGKPGIAAHVSRFHWYQEHEMHLRDSTIFDANNEIIFHKLNGVSSESEFNCINLLSNIEEKKDPTIVDLILVYNWLANTTQCAEKLQLELNDHFGFRSTCFENRILFLLNNIEKLPKEYQEIVKAVASNASAFLHDTRSHAFYRAT